MKLKIVYFGSSLAGKSTNIKVLYKMLKSQNLVKGELVSMQTDEQRTLFMDLFLTQMEIEGIQLDVKVMTTPGQFRLHALRKVIMKDVDGLVFVVDSDAERERANFLVLRETAAVLKERGENLFSFPVIVQYNKRDLPNAMSVDELESRFNPWGTEHVLAVATQGQGVRETFSKIIKTALAKRYAKNHNT